MTGDRPNPSPDVPFDEGGIENISTANRVEAPDRKLLANRPGTRKLNVSGFDSTGRMMKKSDRNFRVPWAMLLLIVLVVYPLSFGPASWCCNQDVISYDMLEVGWMPMFWAYENTALQKPLDLYLSLWGVDGIPIPIVTIH